MFHAHKGTAIFACILIFSMPAIGSAQPPEDGKPRSSDEALERVADSDASTRDDKGVPFWIGARLQLVLPTEDYLVPGAGLGASVMPWDHFGFQGRFSGWFAPVLDDEPWDHVYEVATMFSWYDVGDVGHVSVGVGPSLVRGEFYESVSYDEFASRWFVTGGVAAEVQAGLHLANNFALTLVVSGSATPKTSYVAAAPTLQIGGFE